MFRQATFEDVFISVLISVVLILFMVGLYFLSGKPDVTVDKMKELSLAIQISAALWLLCGICVFLFGFLVFFVGILIGLVFGIYTFLVIILLNIFLGVTGGVCLRIRSGYRTLNYSAWKSSLIFSFVMAIPSLLIAIGSLLALLSVLKLPWVELWNNQWTIFHLLSLILLGSIPIFLFVNSLFVRDQFVHH